MLALVKDEGIRLALSRHPVTAALHDGARSEWPGPSNGAPSRPNQRMPRAGIFVPA